MPLPEESEISSRENNGKIQVLWGSLSWFCFWYQSRFFFRGKRNLSFLATRLPSLSSSSHSQQMSQKIFTIRPNVFLFGSGGSTWFLFSIPIWPLWDEYQFSSTEAESAYGDKIYKNRKLSKLSMKALYCIKASTFLEPFFTFGNTRKRLLGYQEHQEPWRLEIRPMFSLLIYYFCILLCHAV